MMKFDGFVLFTMLKHLILPDPSMVAAPRKVEVQVIAVTGLSPC
jgi:hypothetical protein